MERGRSRRGRAAADALAARSARRWRGLRRIGGGRRADRRDRRQTAPSRSARRRQARRGARRAGFERGLWRVPPRALRLARVLRRDRRLLAALGWEIGGLWDRLRAAERETEAMNLDRKLHVLAVFAEIAATERGRR